MVTWFALMFYALSPLQKERGLVPGFRCWKGESIRKAHDQRPQASFQYGQRRLLFHHCRIPLLPFRSGEAQLIGASRQLAEV